MISLSLSLSLFHAHSHIKQIVSRIINYILASNDVTFSEELIMAGNRCMTELSKCLQGHFASCSSTVATFIIRQLDEQEPPSPDHAHSVVRLLSQVRYFS